MKIKWLLVSTHVFTGVIVIAVFSIIFALITHREGRKEAKVKVKEISEIIKNRLLEDIDNYKNLARLLSAALRIENGKLIIPPEMSLSPDTYDVEVIEITDRDKIYTRAFSSKRPTLIRYHSSESIVKEMWNFMSKSFVEPATKMSFPDVKNGCVVWRNTAIIMTEGEKRGLVIISLPMDKYYLKKLTEGFNYVELFVVSEAGLTSSTDYVENIALQLKETPDGEAKPISVKTRQGNFQIYLLPLYRKKGKVKAYMGIVLSNKTAKRIFGLFGKVSVFVVPLGIVSAFILALIISHHITKPILSLRALTQKFTETYKPIPPPKSVKNEVSELQVAFSKMSKEIVAFKTEIENYSRRLEKLVQERTSELADKLREMTLINTFGYSIISSESLTESEDEFVVHVVNRFGKLSEFDYTSALKVENGSIKVLSEFMSPAVKTTEKFVCKLHSIRDTAARRVLKTKEPFSKRIFGIHIFCYPITFMNEVNYLGFYTSASPEFYMEKWLGGIAHNMISMRVHSIRFYKDKMHSEKLAAIGEFASTVIHDIKNPMTTIKSIAEILTDPDFTEDEKEEYSKMLSREIDILTGMLNDILDFARGEIKLSLETFNLDSLLIDIKNFYQEICREKGIEINLNLKSNAIIKADKNRIWRSIGNLITNAIDVLNSNGKITISSSKKGRFVFIKISDNGPGIPRKIRSKIFDPFFTYGKVEGTGLGLATVKKIIESHNGEITFKTSKKGTTFTLKLPISPEK